MVYMIYGKNEGMSRMKPVDVRLGSFVDRRIYATMWYENEKEKAYEVLDDLLRSNPGMDFEVRKV